jgi:hypothetical protein
MVRTLCRVPSGLEGDHVTEPRDPAVDEQFLILPTSHAGTPFFLSERLGCAFVQEAIGTVDFLKVCLNDTSGPSASATASP